MKTINIEQADFDTCVQDAQRERILVARQGLPVAIVVGVEGLDAEQVQLGSSDAFWKLIRERRRQKTMSQAELEERLNGTKRTE